MKKQIASVEEFHEKFDQENANTPRILILEEATLRHSLMAEENTEYLDACKEKNLVEIADALGDQLYILCGTILRHGMQHKIEEVFDEIHRSNMSKLGPDGKPIYRNDGKILKGEGYFRPNIKKILDETI